MSCPDCKGTGWIELLTSRRKCARCSSPFVDPEEEAKAFRFSIKEIRVGFSTEEFLKALDFENELNAAMFKAGQAAAKREEEALLAIISRSAVYRDPSP